MTQDLTVGKPISRIWQFAVPVLFGLLLQQVYSLVDTAIVGHALGVMALGGVGATGSVNFLVLGFCGGLCTGMAIPLAQAFGAGEYRQLRRYVAGCVWLGLIMSAVLLAVTLGPGVDAQIRRAGVGDIAAGVASDALGSALAEQAADAAEAELRQWAAKEGKYLTGRFSPGYGDWDIAVQPLVANALDTVRRAGLCVTDTNLMTPRKSVTALLGVSDHPVKGKLAGCGHCVLRTRCEYRKRGKTCASE